MTCYICLEETTDLNRAIKICLCQGCYHFNCLKTFVESNGCQDMVRCPNCRRDIYVPKVYYASRINHDSTPPKTVDEEEIIDYRELWAPFHYRIGHWVAQQKHCGFEDNPIERALKQIDECDYVLADIEANGYGTIAEVGLAYGKQKPVFLKNILDWEDIKFTENGVVKVVKAINDNQGHLEKPKGPQNVVITTYEDIWFAQGIANKSLIRLQKLKFSFNAWNRDKHFLPEEMRNIKVSDSDNDGVMFGHFIEI